MNRVRYYQIVKENRPKRHKIRDCLLAFLCGGTIGLISQLLIDLFSKVLNQEINTSIALSSLTLVCISSILTVFSLYNSLGQRFGAGLFVPITGFSNSMVSSSIEGKSEGFIQGIGGRVFSLAGSVICYGVFISVFVVLIRYVLSFFGVSL